MPLQVALLDFGRALGGAGLGLDQAMAVPDSFAAHRCSPSYAAGSALDCAILAVSEDREKKCLSQSPTDETIRQFLAGHYAEGGRWMGEFTVSGGLSNGHRPRHKAVASPFRAMR